MPRTDKQLDRERPDVSEERRKAREKGGATPKPDEASKRGDDRDAAV